MKKTNWDTSRDRDDAEAFAEKCNRFRELEPNPIDDLIMERIVELATE